MAVTGIRRELLKGLYDESITTSYESFALYKTDGTAPVSIYGAISGLFVYVESVVTAATLAILKFVSPLVGRDMSQIPPPSPVMTVATMIGRYYYEGLSANVGSILIHRELSVSDRRPLE